MKTAILLLLIVYSSFAGEGIVKKVVYDKGNFFNCKQTYLLVECADSMIIFMGKGNAAKMLLLISVGDRVSFPEKIRSSYNGTYVVKSNDIKVLK